MAKKKSRRKKRQNQQRPPGYDPNERRRQRLEEKRLQREAAAKAQKRAEFRERLVRGMVFAAVIVAVLWFFFWPRTPSEIDGNPIVESRADRGHTNDPVVYETTPPTTGDHSPSAAPCGIHATQIPDELFVHALEHGAVGVLYDPEEVEVDTIRDIEAKVGEYDDRTISAPYTGTDTPITVTSWTKLMRLDSYDADTVTEYIDAFRGTGPEDLPCENTQETPFDPASLEPAPAPSPAPDDGEGGGNTTTGGNNGGNNDGGNNDGGNNDGGNNDGGNQRRDRDSEDS